MQKYRRITNQNSKCLKQMNLGWLKLLKSDRKIHKIACSFKVFRPSICNCRQMLIYYELVLFLCINNTDVL